MIASLLLAAAIAEPEYCGGKSDQLSLNECANAEFRRADAALNKQWALTLKEVRRVDKDANPLEKREPALRAAQRAWLQFRTAHCDSMYAASMGAQLEYTMNIHCQTAVTEDRTKELADIAQWLKTAY